MKKLAIGDFVKIKTLEELSKEGLLDNHHYSDSYMNFLRDHGGTIQRVAGLAECSTSGEYYYYFNDGSTISAGPFPKSYFSKSLTFSDLAKSVAVFCKDYCIQDCEECILSKFKDIEKFIEKLL